MLPDSYTCRCGVNNIFSSYVYANWEFVMKHNCTCGRQNRILEGKVLDEEETTETSQPIGGCLGRPGVSSEKSPVKKKVRPKKGKA